MPLPLVTIVGNLTADPDLSFTKNGDALLKMRVAANEAKKDPSGNWIDGRSTFVDVVIWRKLAEDCAATLVKGEKVQVVGRLVQSDYETKDGEKRSRLEVHADTVARPITLGGAGTDRKPASRFVDEEPF